MNQRIRSVELYNMDILDVEPEMEPVDVVPKRMIGFNYARSRYIGDACVHFFLDDYQFERVWRFPTRYGYLRRAQCVCTPDFSLYKDFPYELCRWNNYRSYALGAWWQSQGLTVIPTLQWMDVDSYGWCFKYVPKGGTVAVCAKGSQRTKEHRRAFAYGLSNAIEICKPKRVLLLGKAEFDFGEFDGLDVVCYVDGQIRRFEDVKKRPQA